MSLPDVIEQAIGAAFPNQTVEQIAPLSGGRSGAALWSFRVAGGAYVVRQPDPNRFMHEARAERERVCMMHASDWGVAPKIHFLDATSNVVIMDRIEPAALGRRTPGAPGYVERLERLARTLRALHEKPASSFPSGSHDNFVSAVDQKLREGGGEGLPSALCDAVLETVAPMARFAELAPCHKDLNPGNVLETADRVYFIDWEAASTSDPFYDLASLSVFSFPTAEGREALLTAYVGREPTEEERDRNALARTMALGFCAASFIHLSRLTKGPSPLPPPLPMLALLAKMGDPQGPPPADVIASSLLGTLLEERSTETYQSSLRRLTASVR